MSTQRELSQSILQVIFSIFLGLVVVAFVGIGVNTFYPSPIGPDGNWDQAAWSTWQLNTSAALLVCATVVMVLSMIRSELAPVIANGVLLGGLFTMIYAVGMSISVGNQWPRFALISVALVISVGVGYWKFTRRRPAPAAAAAGGGAADPELAARVTAMEGKLEALGRVLGS